MWAPTLAGEDSGLFDRSPETPLPTILRVGPYRLFFYMADRGEPPHVHIERNGHEAEFWLDAVRVAYGRSFQPTELRRIERIVEENRYALLEGWDENF